MSSHDEITDIELKELSESELRFRQQGCTELTCLYHGKYNMELKRRNLPRVP